jgi:hypothetical protein
MDALPVPSRIEGVTVYRRGARITRVAEIECNESVPSTVRLTGLPLSLDDGSVRVRVESIGSGTTPPATDLRVALDLPDTDEALPPFVEGDLEDARADEAHAATLVKQIEQELGRLELLTLEDRPDGYENEPPKESPLAARLALVDFRESVERKLRSELSDARERLETAKRKRQDAEERDRHRTSARRAREHELRKAVVVSLSSNGGKSPERLHLFLDYLVPGARWAPAYTARLDTAMTKAELGVRAVVAQNTGEDWSRVKLALSTAKAETWTELPELSSRRIGRRQRPVARTGWRPPPTGVEELFADFDRAFEEVPEVMDLAIDSLVHETPAPPQAAASAPAAMAESDDLGNIVFDEMEELPRLSEPRTGGFVARDISLAGAALREPDQEEEASGALRAYVKKAPEPVTASAALLDYGRLRMAPASSSSRGRLRIVEQRESYVEILRRERVEISFDVMTVAQHAVARAMDLREDDLPPGCEWAWADDYDYAYVSDDAVDVSSDGACHSVPLTSRATTAEPLYIVVPRESRDVFRTVEMRNPLEAPLLDGPVDVYHDGYFLLTTEVRFTPPGSTARVGLGVEQRVKVSRNTRFREEAAGIMHGSIGLTHEIHIEALNHAGKTVALEIRERVPVPRKTEEDIKIEIKDVTPAWEPFEPEASDADARDRRLEGGYRWRASLGAGERMEFCANYEIRIPAKNEIVGGNRRES